MNQFFKMVHLNEVVQKIIHMMADASFYVFFDKP